MTPILNRKKSSEIPPSTEEILNEMDSVVDTLKDALVKLREHYKVEEVDQQEKNSEQA